MKYRPDIDGLRAIAVIAVLFYHAHLGFSDGYVGVDIFFVISGFLITALLVRGVRNQTFTYLDFWERRIRRLIPALAATVAFIATTGFFVLLPKHLKDLGGALIAQPLMSSNVYFWRVVRSGYFADPPEIRPLLHTWSLGVEEQFYLLVPLLLVFILKRATLAAHLKKILVAIALASLALSISITPSANVFSFFMLPTRAWELLLGGLVALRLSDAPPEATPPSHLFTELIAALGLALVTYSIFFYPYSTPFPGVAAVAPCLGTALMIWANSFGRLTLVGKLLALPFMVLIGQISYSLYLWHWPLIAYGDYLFLLHSTQNKWIVVVLSCCLGYLSWRWVETPFRKKQLLQSKKAIFKLFKYYALACVGTGIICLAIAPLQLKVNPGIAKATNPFWYDVDPEALVPELPSLGAKSSSSTILLWGDSHAMALAPALDKVGKENNLRVVQLTHNASAPLINWSYRGDVKLFASSNFKEKWANLALQQAQTLKPNAVILVGFWQEYSGPSFFQYLEQTIDTFNKIGVQVVFVSDNPTLSDDPWRRANLASRFSLIEPPTVGLKAAYMQQNELLYRELSKLSRSHNLKVIDLAPSIFSWQKLITQAGKLLYFDDDHISETGALKLYPLFEPLFKELAPPISFP